MKSRKLPITSFSVGKYTCIYLKWLLRPVVLQEHDFNKMLPGGIVTAIAQEEHTPKCIGYFFHLGNLNQIISFDILPPPKKKRKRKKEKNQNKTLWQLQQSYITINAFFPPSRKLIARFQDPRLNINHILLSGSFTLYKFWKSKLEFLVRPN